MKKMKFLFLLLLGLSFRTGLLFGNQMPIVVGSSFVVNSPFNLKYFKSNAIRVPIKSDVPADVLIVSIQKDGYAFDTFDPTISFDPGSYEHIKNFSEKLVEIENKKGNTNNLKIVKTYFVALEYMPKTFGKEKLHIKLSETLEKLLKEYVAYNNTKVILLTSGDTANVVSLVTKKIDNGKIDTIIYLDPVFKKGNNHNFDKVGKIYNFYTKNKNKIEQFVKDDRKAPFGKDIVCSNIYTSFVHNGLKRISLDKKFSDKKNNVFLDPFYRVIHKFINLTDTYYNFFKGSLSGVFSKNLYTFLCLKSDVTEAFGSNDTGPFVDLFDANKELFRITFNNPKVKNDHEHKFSWETAFSSVSFEDMKRYFNLKPRDLKKISFLVNTNIWKIEEKIITVKNLKKWEEDWKFYPPKKSLNPKDYTKIKKIRAIINKEFLFLKKMGGEHGDDIIGIIPFAFTKYPFLSALSHPIGTQPFIEGPYSNFLKFANKNGDERFEILVKDAFKWLVDLEKEKSEYSTEVFEELKIFRKLVFYSFFTIPGSVDLTKSEKAKKQMIRLAKRIARFCIKLDDEV